MKSTSLISRCKNIRTGLLVLTAALTSTSIGRAQCFLPVAGPTTQPTAVAASSDSLVVVGTFYPGINSPVRAFRWLASDNSFTDLGTINGGISCSPTAISADGSVVVGWSQTSSAVHAFRWAANEAVNMLDLQTLPGGSDSAATAVSADGSLVVGWSQAGGLNQHAFRWRIGDTALEDLQTLPGGSFSVATGLSADGQVIVGYGDNSAGQIHGLVWPAGASSPSDLQALPGQNSSLAKAVSADGSTVLGLGEADAPGYVEDAIRWTLGSGGFSGPADLAMTLVPTNSSSTPSIISADGTVVAGTVTSMTSAPQAARWTVAGGVTLLGTIDNAGTYSASTVLSADGSVVVGSGDLNNTPQVAFRWSAVDQVMKSLQSDFGLPIPSDWTLLTPISVSADGQRIVGNGSVSPSGSVVWLAALRPVMTSLYPQSALVGSPGFTLTVNGYCFGNDAVIYWNGVAKNTTLANGQLSATILSTDLTLGVNQNINTVLVTVEDSGGVVGSLPFTIVNSTIGPTQSQTALPGQTVAVSAPTTGGGPPVMSATINNPAGSPPVTVSAATYASTPAVGIGFETGTAFVDLQVLGATVLNSIVVTFYSPNPAPNLLYWDSAGWHQVLSSGGVMPTWVQAPSSALSSATIILDSTSTPPITALSGTPFGLPIPPVINCPGNIVVSTDPGQCSAVVHYTVTASANSGSATVVCSPPSGATFSKGATTVNCTATAGPGNQATCSFTVTVNDTQPPAVGSISAPSSPVAVPSQVNASANFTDNCGPHTAVWDWGDGTTSAGAVTEANGSGLVAGSHAYTAAGVYTLSLTVKDEVGNHGQAVFQYVVIYDPSAGFVTGGGWINSPAGAYAANPGLTGKATFGFVSKYQKGASVPAGQTEFHFQMASFNFQSTAYQWLVISGAKAQYKGSGTVNGISGYSFILTATDGEISGGGGVDKFRIHITNTATGATAYDNVPGAADDINNANPEAIAGGDIVIHSN